MKIQQRVCRVIGFLCFLGFVTFVQAGIANACKIVIPEPPIWPRHVQIEPIRTREHNVNVNIRNQVAEVTVQATFFNPNNTDLEGD